MFNSLEKFKKNIALINNNEDEYSYEHLLKLINLINAKIKKRSLILLITSNSAESIIGYVSFIKFNNVTILFNSYTEVILSRLDILHEVAEVNGVPALFKSIGNYLF